MVKEKLTLCLNSLFDEGLPPLPPVAHASGSHSLTLPNNSLVLRGSVTDGDQTQVRFLWVRDGQSPAAGVGTGIAGQNGSQRINSDSKWRKKFSASVVFCMEDKNSGNI